MEHPPDTIEITVTHYFNYSIYFPFMSEHLFELLHDAFYNHQQTVNVPKEEFDKMVRGYLETLWN